MENITTHTVRTERTTGKHSKKKSHKHAHGQPAMFEGLESRTLYAAQFNVQAGQSIQAAVNQAGPGDTIVVSSGTYQQNVNFSRSGTWSAPITLTAAGGANVAIEGYVAGNGTNITVQGITVQNVRNKLQNENAALRTNTGWVVRNVTVQNNTGAGVGVFGNGVVLDRVNSWYNGESGIGGAGVSNSMIQNCTVAWNNRGVVNPPWAGQANTLQIGGKWYASPVWEGGGGKWNNTTNTAFMQMNVHDNGGPGLWFDGGNSNIYVMNGQFYNDVGVDQSWQGMGLQVEISAGPFYIFNNYFHDNQASGLDISESQHADILWNTFYNNDLELRAMRGRQYTLDDVDVYNNLFVNASPFFSIRESIGWFSIHNNVYDTQADLTGGRAMGENSGVIR